MDDAQIEDENEKNEITDSDEAPSDTVYKESDVHKEIIENKENKEEEDSQSQINNNNEPDTPKLPENLERASRQFDNENENVNNNNKSQLINYSQNYSISEEPSPYKNEHIVSVRKIDHIKYKEELRSQYRDSRNGLYPEDNYSKRKSNSLLNGNRKNLFYRELYNKKNYEDELIPRIMFFQKDGNHLPGNHHQYQYEHEYEDDNEIIPRVIFFQRDNEYLLENKKMNRNNNSEMKKIQFEEFTKYKGKKKLNMSPGRGMNKGEYIFNGGKTKLVERDISEEKVKIEEEEIYKEINRRKEHYSKEKKINYKVIDKYYTTIEIRRSLTRNSEELSNKTKNINQNHINLLKISNKNDSLFPTDNYSQYYLTQINKIRTDPQSIIGIIEDAKDHIIKDKYGRIIYNRDVKIALTKGKYAFDDTIEFLKKQKPMKRLEYKSILTIKSPSEESDVEDKTYMKKEIRKKIVNGLSIKSYWRDIIRDPEISFILMIVDDNGAKSGKRRNDILDPNMKYIGISSVEINNSFACFIVLSTGE